MKRSSTAINQSTSMLGSSKSKMSRLVSSKSMQKGQKQGKKVTEPESAAGYHMIRSMDGKRKYIPLEDFSKERRKSKNQLMSIKEVERPDSSESDSDKTEISGTETEKSYASSESDSDDLGSSTSKDDNDDAESVEEESSDSDAEQQDAITFDDGTGKLPIWMEGRMILAGGLLEDELRPLQFMSIPVYHAMWAFGFSLMISCVHLTHSYISSLPELNSSIVREFVVAYFSGVTFERGGIDET